MTAGRVLPLSFFGGYSGSPLIQKAYAVSTKSQPLGSNIFVEIAKKQNPAVVNISTKTKRRARSPRPPRDPRAPGGKDPFQDFYDKFFGDRDKKPRSGMGSGFIIDKEGYILTNNHVIDGADEIVVLIEEGGNGEKEYDAKLIGADSKTDIALIKLILKDGDKKNFPALSLGNSDKLEVGEWVVAIGNPFGLSHTVTVGVVSAKERNIGSGPYDEFIQTDASINPGNSGGPLMNIKGEVIGINTAIISGNSGGNVGIGFAVPTKIASSIMRQILDFGEVRRGLLGVTIQGIDAEVAEALNATVDRGALITVIVPGSAAEQSGLQVDDIIVAVNDDAITDAAELRNAIGLMRSGDDVHIDYIRDGDAQSTTAVLGQQQAANSTGSDIHPGLEGAQFATLTTSSGAEGGIEVTEVDAGSPASQRGIRSGDIITAVNRRSVRNVQQLRELASANRILFLLVQRGDRSLMLQIR